MKISDVCTYTGSVIGMTVSAGGSFVLPVFCKMAQMSEQGEANCINAAVATTLLLAAGGAALGACAGKITGVAIEKIGTF